MSDPLPVGETVQEQPRDAETLLRGDTLAVWALRQIKDAEDGMEQWRKQAKEADAFMAGRHFSKQDLEKLEREARPTAAFNIAQKFIRFVGGLERQSRQDIRFLPREILDDKSQHASELVSKTFDYILQNCEGHDERSRAFQDLLVRGMGWTDITFDRSKDVSGSVLLTRIDGHEMFWDHHSTRNNLIDARWVARQKYIPRDIAMERWPDYAPVIAANTGDRDLKGMRNTSTLRSEVEAVPESLTIGLQPKRGQVGLIEFQWFEEVPGFYFYDPIEKKDDWLDEKTFKEYEKRYKRVSKGKELESDRLLMRQYQRMLICGRTIIAGPHRLPGKRFTFNCMTGQWDAEESLWYGYMKFLMDPQKYLTKFVNQVMEIITRQAKGGLLAEMDAFANMTQAEENYAKVGSITWLNPNGLSKVQEKGVTQIPPASIEMFRVCADMLKEVTGINPEIAMGVGAADQPAMTMRQRQLASIALLAEEFASLERYRIHEARTMFEFLPMIADDRIIRVGGPYESEALQLIRDPFLLEYDIVLDEGIRDPNIREQYLQTIMGIAPTLIRTGNFLPEIVDFFPLPGSIRYKLKESIKASAQAAQEQKAMGMDGKGGPKQIAQDPPEEIAARVAKLNADAEFSRVKAAMLLEQVKDQQLKTQLEADLQNKETDIEREKVQQQNKLTDSNLAKNVIEGLQAFHSMGQETQQSREEKPNGSTTKPAAADE